MIAALVRAYRVVLACYPGDFRRRYAQEMRLDFEDALQEAVAAGAVAVLRVACRQGTDTCWSLVREWSRGPRVVTAAATTVITVALWGLALRPWSWPRHVPARHRDSVTTAPVDGWELLVLAAAAIGPVIGAIVLASRLGLRARPTPRRR